MERDPQLEGAPHAASRYRGRGNRWRALRDRRSRGSDSRPDARSASGRTRTRGRNSLISASPEAATNTMAAKENHFRPRSGRVERLLTRFHQIRDFTNSLCAGLEPEDFVVQSMPDVSPTKWHLAHTTWFFETFVLKKFALRYRSEIPQYAYLFTSYYNAAGDMHRRDLRGLISRPTGKEAQRYRSSIASRPGSNGEYIAFIEDNGYARPEFWLSLGWMTVNEQHWQAPLYWVKRDGGWWNFTLSGFRPVAEFEPVTHVSYFAADAYANWAGSRLPTEFEWERAASDCPIEGNFVENEAFHPQPDPASVQARNLHLIFGYVLE